MQRVILCLPVTDADAGALTGKTKPPIKMGNGKGKGKRHEITTDIHTPQGDR